jgi:hypothetical protein
LGSKQLQIGRDFHGIGKEKRGIVIPPQIKEGDLRILHYGVIHYISGGSRYIPGIKQIPCYEDIGNLLFSGIGYHPLIGPEEFPSTLSGLFFLQIGIHF